MAKFRIATLQSLSSKVSKKGKYILSLRGPGGTVIIAATDSLPNAKYIRLNLRRFFKRTLGATPKFRIAKAG